MRTVFLVLIFAFCTYAHGGPVYKCTDSTGKKLYQDRPCDGAAKSGANAQSTGLTKESIQGKWAVTLSPNDKPEGDYWIFKGNQWTVMSGSHSLRPDAFRIQDNRIQFDSYSINVLAFDGSTMTVKTQGITQYLTKVN